MKNNRIPVIGLLVLATLLITSCGQEERERLQAENEELKMRLETESTVVRELISDMEVIRGGLRDITEQEGLLAGRTLNDVELAKSPKERVMEDISRLDALLVENKQRLAEMESKLKRSEGKAFEFERVIANLKLDILDKESSIQGFKERLVDLEEGYAELLDDYHEQLLISEIQDEALHSVWYAYGTAKELMDQDVMEKKGGVLGVGHVKRLKDDFDRSYFTEVDMRSLEKVELGVDQAELLTQHPADSYQWVKDDNGRINFLRITDPQVFWSTTKYMAMLVE